MGRGREGWRGVEKDGEGYKRIEMGREGWKEIEKDI